jgi:Tetratricopeptide repeat
MKYNDAKPMYERTLKIRESVLGENHPDVAQSLNKMASAVGKCDNTKSCCEGR